MNKKILITFAGAIGSSKTPIAYYLSYIFNLPIFNADAIRSEIIEDLLLFDQKEFESRKNKRLNQLIRTGKSFILDASIDRKWKDYKKNILKENYKTLIISLDLSKEFLIALYKSKGYKESLKRVNVLYEDHQNFLKEFSNDIFLHITDQNFKERLKLSKDKIKKFI